MVGPVREEINSTPPPGNAELCNCFIMDNLSVHASIVVAQTIHDVGHRLAFRAPDHTVDGPPIEYVFNTIQQALPMKLYQVYTGRSVAGGHT
jgi:hypothetical protein